MLLGAGLAGMALAQEVATIGRVAPDGCQHLDRVAAALHEVQLGKPAVRVVAYGGEQRTIVGGTELLPWSDIGRFAWS